MAVLWTLKPSAHGSDAVCLRGLATGETLSSYMGHASITITLDRYGHLLPGNEQEAAGLLDTWLTANAQSTTR